MKRHRNLAKILTAALLITNITNMLPTKAFAEEATPNSIEILSTEITSDMHVSGHAGAKFIVGIPTTIILYNQNDKAVGEYSISVAGELEPNTHLSVTPEMTVPLQRRNDSTEIDIAITNRQGEQPKTSWDVSELNFSDPYILPMKLTTASALNSGEYSGTLTYDIRLGNNTENQNENNESRTVRLHLNRNSNAEDIETIEIEAEQQDLSIPTNFAYTGHHIDSWYDNEELSGEAVTDIEDNTDDYYAKWGANQVTISYNANGGTNAPEQQVVTYGINSTLDSATAMQYDEHEFVGWSETADGETIENTSDTAFGWANTEAENSKTLYAIWNEVEQANYSIALVDKLSGVESTTSLSSVSGSLTSVAAEQNYEVPSYNGYTFIGWYDDRIANGGDLVIDADGSLVDDKTLSEALGDNESVTLYARYSKPIYERITSASNLKNGSNYIFLVLEKGSNSGASFKDNAGYLIANNKTNYCTSNGGNQDLSGIDHYATNKYSGDYYYISDNGEGIYNSGSNYYIDDLGMTQIENVWRTAHSQVAPTSQYINTTIPESAVWTWNDGVISLANSPENKLYNNNSHLDVGNGNTTWTWASNKYLKDTSATKYVHNNYWDLNIDGGLADKGNTVWIYEQKTVYCDQVPMPQPEYTVTVNKDSGISSVTGGGSYTVGSTVTVGATASTGYHLDQFEVTSGDITINGDTFTMPRHNVGITAKSVPNTVIITYNANGHGTAPEPTTHVYGVSSNLAIMYGEENYNFVGWAESSDASEIDWRANETSTTAFGYADANAENAKTLYAVWDVTEPIKFTLTNSNTSDSQNNNLITEVKTYYPDGRLARTYTSDSLIDNSQTNTNTEIECFTGGDVELYKSAESSNMQWGYYTNDYVDKRYMTASDAIYFTVPDDATGGGSLTASDFTESDILALYGNGWAELKINEFAPRPLNNYKAQDKTQTILYLTGSGYGTSEVEVYDDNGNLVRTYSQNYLANIGKQNTEVMPGVRIECIPGGKLVFKANTDENNEEHRAKVWKYTDANGNRKTVSDSEVAIRIPENAVGYACIHLDKDSCDIDGVEYKDNVIQYPDGWFSGIPAGRLKKNIPITQLEIPYSDSPYVKVGNINELIAYAQNNDFIGFESDGNGKLYAASSETTFGEVALKTDPEITKTGLLIYDASTVVGQAKNCSAEVQAIANFIINKTLGEEFMPSECIESGGDAAGHKYGFYYANVTYNSFYNNNYYTISTRESLLAGSYANNMNYANEYIRSESIGAIWFGKYTKIPHSDSQYVKVENINEFINNYTSGQILFREYDDGKVYAKVGNYGNNCVVEDIDIRNTGTVIYDSGSLDNGSATDNYICGAEVADIINYILHSTLHAAYGTESYTLPFKNDIASYTTNMYTIKQGIIGVRGTDSDYKLNCNANTFYCDASNRYNMSITNGIGFGPVQTKYDIPYTDFAGVHTFNIERFIDNYNGGQVGFITYNRGDIYAISGDFRYNNMPEGGTLILSGASCSIPDTQRDNHDAGNIVCDTLNYILYNTLGSDYGSIERRGLDFNSTYSYNANIDKNISRGFKDPRSGYWQERNTWIVSYTGATASEYYDTSNSLDRRIRESGSENGFRAASNYTTWVWFGDFRDRDLPHRDNTNVNANNINSFIDNYSGGGVWFTGDGYGNFYVNEGEDTAGTSGILIYSSPVTTGNEETDYSNGAMLGDIINYILYKTKGTRYTVGYGTDLLRFPPTQTNTYMANWLTHGIELVRTYSYGYAINARGNTATDKSLTNGLNSYNKYIPYNTIYFE